MNCKTPRRAAAPALRPSSLAAALLLALAAPLAAASTTEAEVIPGRLLVMPRAGVSDAALGRLLAAHGGQRSRRLGGGLRLVELPNGAERALLQRLQRHPQIKFAELDRRVAPVAAVNDPYAGSQWHLPKLGAEQAWDRAAGAGVTIAILDTGVDGNHPDLAARLVPGWNIYDGNADSADVHGHGTSVAGSAAASADNGIGVASVAPLARIMPVRVAAPDGMAAYSAIAEGLNWAAANGAKVANISFAVSGSSAVQNAANALRRQGGLVLVAAGNGGSRQTQQPTSALITVSGTNAADARASFSNYGPYVSLAAPGEAIYTTRRGGGYGSASGTSFAAPVAAGVVGLVMSANPSLSADEVERLIFDTAADLGAAGRDDEFGWGRVDAAAAVAAAVAAAPVADSAPPQVSIVSPRGGDVVTGWVAVDVDARDDRAVARVDLKVNGSVVASDSSAPYAFSWDSALAANGDATLQAVAYDSAGHSAVSAAVAVSVNNVAVVDTSAPTASLSGVVDGGSVSGMAKLRGSASDNAGSAGLSQTLFLDGVAVASASGGTLAWTWNTRKSGPGAHTLRLRVRDAAGNESNDSLTVTVSGVLRR